MDNLSKHLGACYAGCSIGNTKVNHLLYADDLVIFAPSPGGLQDLINVCHLYALKFDIKYNSKKSMVMVIRSKDDRNDNFGRFIIGDLMLEEATQVKYLGHILNENLSDDKDIERQKRYMYAKGNILKRQFHKCSFSVKLLLFKTYCFNMYTSQLWCDFNIKSFSAFVISYNQAFRMLTGFPNFARARFMFTFTDVGSCGEIMRKVIYRFHIRVSESDNSIVHNIMSSNVARSSLLVRHWRSCLYTNTVL